MSPADSQSFPLELGYLMPALKELAKIPEAELRDDVETNTLDNALRERLKGLKLRDAITRLTEDVKMLNNWLKAEKVDDGWAVWISAYLMRPGPLARTILAPPAPPGPAIEMETPSGWSSKRVPKQFIATKEKFFCMLTLFDQSGYEAIIQKNEFRERAQNDPSHPLPHPGKWLKSPVQFGEYKGYKYSYSQSSPRWKALEYVLEVRGGFVYVQHGHERGKDFDESEIESKFHTIKILPPG